MRFGLRQGPWKTIFRGEFQGHETEMLLNQQNIVLVAVYEKEGEKLAGVLLQAYAVFNAVGDLGGFVDTMERQAVILSRHVAGSTINFVCLASKPVYSKPREEEMADSVDELIGKVGKGIEVTLDIALAYDLQLTELNKCSSAVKEAFFTQPLAVPGLMATEPGEEAAAGPEPVPAKPGTVIFGITREGKPVAEPLLLFKSTLVVGPSAQTRLHAMHLMVEACLLSNAPTIIFDEAGEFAGLNHPNKNLEQLHKFQVQIEPIGFPIKQFNVPGQVTVDLNSVDVEGMLELFGYESTAGKQLAKVLQGSKPKSVQRLLSTIDSAAGKSEGNRFLFQRNARVVKLIDLLYPDLFNGGNDIASIAKKWFKDISRASIINVADLDDRARLLLVDGLAAELLAFFKEKGTTKSLRVMLVLPNADKLFPVELNNSQKHLLSTFEQMLRFGVGFVAGSGQENRLNKRFRKLAGAKAVVIKENDAAIQMPGKKGYRLLLRPGLSNVAETQG